MNNKMNWLTGFVLAVVIVLSAGVAMNHVSQQNHSKVSK